MPPYAIFLKYLCTTKRATSVPKKTFLTFGPSFIIFYLISVKYKDPNCLPISIAIGDQLIHRAWLDLGASVNLIPFIECDMLGLGKMKPTKMVI